MDAVRVEWSRQALGHDFTDLRLLIQALTHPSHAFEAGRAGASNQRLEFLGDAVLGLAAAHLVFRDYPEWPEGPMTKLKNALVSAPVLAKRAREMGVGPLLLLGRGEARSGGAERESNLADAFEALVGAVFLDGGLAIARKLIERELAPEVQLAAQGLLAPNYKAELLELAQARHLGTPTYAVSSSSGPEHQPEFCVVVMVGGQTWGQGRGASKKAAEQEAARVGLVRLRG